MENAAKSLLPNSLSDVFHVPPGYFLSHSVGCMPRAAQDAIDEHFFEAWRSGETWSRWMPLMDAFRAGIGDLLNADARCICPQQNVSSGLTKILGSLPIEDGRNVIVFSAQDFPTIGFVLKQAERLGFKLRMITKPPTLLSAWQEALDETVAFAHITHVLSNTSAVLPVGEICKLAHQYGARSIVDVAQSLIVQATDVRAWNADFALGTGVKYLCAGPGAAFLYVKDSVLEHCHPIDVGWFSHEAPFEMDIRRFAYAEDAMRFFGGTPSPAPLAQANCAIEVWNEIGLSNVQSQIQSHLDQLLKSVPEEILVSPAKRPRGATLVLNPPDRASLSSVLDAEKIMFDERADGLRLSVHQYTPAADIDLLRGVLENAF